MVNYDNSSIYKLCCRNTDIKEIYIGSTVNFTRRKQQHKTSCINDKSKEYNFNVYKFIRDNGNWENWDMVEIEKVNCKDKRELHTKEREFIEKYESKLNMSIPYKSNEEKKETKKKYKELRKEINKNYYLENKEKLRQQQREYYLNNIEKIKERKKLNYEKKKSVSS